MISHPIGDDEIFSLRIVNAPHISVDEVRSALHDAVRKNSRPACHGLGRWQVTIEGSPGGFTVVVRIPSPPREYIGVGRDLIVVDALEQAVSRIVTKLCDDVNSDTHTDRSRADGLPRLAQALEHHDDDQRGQFDDVVREHLPELKRFIEHELAHLRSASLLATDYPTADDVMDDTLVRALEDLPFRTEVTPVASWLVGLANMVLDHEVSLARHRDRGGLSGLAMRQVRRLHEEDENRPLDRHITEWVELDMSEVEGATTEADASETLAAEELRAFLMEVLTDLPTKWRRAVILVYVDEQTTETAAMTLGMPVQSLEAALDHATAYLRARLKDEQISLLTDRSPMDFLAWPRMQVGYTADLEVNLSRLTDTRK